MLDQIFDDEINAKCCEMLTRDPSSENIKRVQAILKERFDDTFSIEASIELIAMAVEPVHPGITRRLRRI